MARNSTTATAVGKVFANQIEVWPLDRFVMYARNPRKHTADTIDRMAGSLVEFGFPIPLLARKSTGEVVDGHLRLKGAKKAGLTEAPFINCDGWTPAQVKAFRLMANRSVNWAEWDEELLGLEMQDLKGLEFDLDLTGFDEDEWDRLLVFGVPAGGDGEKESSLLSRMNITIAEPTTKVTAGDIWHLTEHVLICESVIEGWPTWSKYLKQDALFCPFPGPFVLLSERAKEHPLVLAQPDTYVAGHIVDRYIEVHGQDSVRLEAQTQ